MNFALFRIFSVNFLPKLWVSSPYCFSSSAAPGVTAVNGVSAVVASLLLLASLRLPASLLLLGSYCCGTPSDALALACVPTLDGVSAVAACSVANVYIVVGIPMVAGVLLLFTSAMFLLSLMLSILMLPGFLLCYWLPEWSSCCCLCPRCC